MRVLHFLKTSVGASWAVRQTRELVRLGLDVHVVLPPGPMLQAYRSVGVTTNVMDASLDLRKPHVNVRRFKRIRELVESVKPEVIHCHFVANALALRFALGRKHTVKRIFHVPGPLHLEHPFFRAAEILSAGPSDFWLASCEWTRRCYIRSGVSPQRVGLAYYGIDVPQFDPSRSGALRREFGVGANVPVVGNVAYLYPPKRYLGQKVGLKGHEDLIQAVDQAAVEVPGLTCFIVGGPWGGAGWYFEKVRRLAEKSQHARIIMTGYRNDVQEIYNDFDVAVHPSHSENVGGALESLTHYIPTIATNVGGFPDLVLPEQTGWLVPPRDPVSLARAIVSAFENRDYAKMLACRGRQRVEQLFNVQRNAQDIVGYYERMLETGQLDSELKVD